MRNPQHPTASGKSLTDLLRRKDGTAMSETTTVQTLRDRVENALAAVRPSLQAHGGDVELVDVTDEGVVSVRLAGACHGCAGAVMTLRMGVERLLKQQVLEVTRVEAV